MGSKLGSLDPKDVNQDSKIRIIGYGTFLWDAITDLAVGINPKVWGENVSVLGAIKVEGYRRLWSGKTSYPVIQKADEYFFFGILFEIGKHQLPRFDQIEGVPTLYTREMIQVKFKGDTISAFIYIPSKKLLQHVLHEYELAGIEPGFDDWADHLQKVLSPEEIDVFPEIFSN